MALDITMEHLLGGKLCKVMHNGALMLELWGAYGRATKLYLPVDRKMGEIVDKIVDNIVDKYVCKIAYKIISKKFMILILT